MGIGGKVDEVLNKERERFLVWFRPEKKPPPIRIMEGIAVDMLWFWLWLYNFSAVQMSGVAARRSRVESESSFGEPCFFDPDPPNDTPTVLSSLPSPSPSIP